MWTLLRSPPMTSPDTSLATIQSAPLRSRFACAFATTLSVSAAKPMTRRGRRAERASSARISGFSTSVRVGGPPAPFFAHAQLERQLLHADVVFGRSASDSVQSDGGEPMPDQEPAGLFSDSFGP